MLNDNSGRKSRIFLSSTGATYIARRDPYIVLWLSATFPGFGHIIMGQYARGILLTLLEITINTLGHVNEAMVYTFRGKFDLAAAALEPRWMYGYIIFYLFAIWSSYHSAFTLNRLCHLSELEKVKMPRLKISAFEIQYLERKNPNMAALWSFAFPGLGFLYNQRLVLGFYAIVWWWIKGSLANAFDSLFLLFSGRWAESVAVLDQQWLLYMPSVMGGSIYYAYMQANDQNRLFITEQKQFLTEQYGGGRIHGLFRRKAEGYANH